MLVLFSRNRNRWYQKAFTKISPPGSSPKPGKVNKVVRALAVVAFSFACTGRPDCLVHDSLVSSYRRARW